MFENDAINFNVPSENPYIDSNNRPPMNQEEFDLRFRYCRPIHRRPLLIRKAAKFSRRYYRPFTSPRAFFNAVFNFIPILKWLPRYNFKDNIIYDILGGLTVGVMHVPQGIAYALLANVEPVIGLYTSFFPPLFYMIFGTSHHNSIGSFAVVALMAGIAVQRTCEGLNTQTPSDDNNSTITSTISSTDTQNNAYNLCTRNTASTLAFCVGLIHIVMGILRLEIITTYFSDQLISGFTTAASLQVFSSQLRALFGIHGFKDPTGIGNVFRRLYLVAKNISHAHIPTCIVSACTIIALIIGKEFISPFLQKRLRLPTPFPVELVVVIMSTLISFLLNLHGKFHVDIVDDIPTGLPAPSFPKFSDIPDLFPDAISIAVVVVAIHISLAQMFAKKLNYKVDSGQELYALGFASSLASFFPVYPVSCSLGRTMVNVEAGTKTLLATITSSIFLLLIIIFMGKWLETLPMCVLSATVIVALKGMVKKFWDLKILWPLSKIDFSIWVVSFLATAGLDVTPGLIISIVYALMTTVLRSQFPRWHFLAQLTGTCDFRDIRRYKETIEYKGICIYRFDSPLIFTNVERFKQSIQKAFDIWLGDILPQQSILPEEIKVYPGEEKKINHAFTIHSLEDYITPDKPVAGLIYRHLIIDCSGFAFVDYMGVNALKEIFTEMRKQKVLMYFAAAKAPVRDLFEASGFYKYVSKDNFYPTISDAIAIAKKRQKTSAFHLLDEIRLTHDPLDQIVHSQPLN
uniref:STAS domain-containing protein n=1 Tax=Panagrolaimus sp. PS1159 TaxID=55785 RepID=A0AC35F0C8_9BILA